MYRFNTWISEILVLARQLLKWWLWHQVIFGVFFWWFFQQDVGDPSHLFEWAMQQKSSYSRKRQSWRSNVWIQTVVRQCSWFSSKWRFFPSCTCCKDSACNFKAFAQATVFSLCWLQCTSNLSAAGNLHTVNQCRDIVYLTLSRDKEKTKKLSLRTATPGSSARNRTVQGTRQNSIPFFEKVVGAMASLEAMISLTKLLQRSRTCMHWVHWLWGLH